MRALTLIYHEDLEPAINGIIARQMVVARYTKIRDVVGARTDVMQDADYEPHGKNHMLIMVAECEVIVSLAHDFQDLRRQHGHGLRGYITPVEEII